MNAVLEKIEPGRAICPAKAPPLLGQRFERLPIWLRILVISGLIVTPCFWQSRIQAGDLSSHIYNAWLSTLIQQGKAPGLVIVPQWTNVLFDLELTWLFQHFGRAVAESVAVSTSVLIFFWGAFALAGVMLRRWAWAVMPFLSMLAYGWVFQMGFMNFYLSMGLCCWAIALLLWKANPLAFAGVLLLMGLAWLAQALPVAWAVGAMGYMWSGRKLPTRYRLLLFLSAIGGLLVLRAIITTKFPFGWSWGQAAYVTGIDQFWTFDAKYFGLACVMLCLLAILLLQFLERGDEKRIRSVALEFAALTGIAVLLLPTRVHLPGFNHALVYIAERMSLGTAVLSCIALVSQKNTPGIKIAMALITAAFFAFLYHDTRTLNEIEDRIDRAVAQLPPNQRVVSALADPGSRVNRLVHMVDRACVGMCFSYGNYEPTTNAFRVRVAHANAMNVSEYGDSYELQSGSYKVKTNDLPLFQIYSDGSQVRTRLLKHRH